MVTRRRKMFTTARAVTRYDANSGGRKVRPVAAVIADAAPVRKFTQNVLLQRSFLLNLLNVDICFSFFCLAARRSAKFFSPDSLFGQFNHTTLESRLQGFPGKIPEFPISSWATSQLSRSFDLDLPYYRHSLIAWPPQCFQLAASFSSSCALWFRCLRTQ